MSINYIILDESILDIDSWLSNDAFDELITFIKTTQIENNNDS